MSNRGVQSRQGVLLICCFAINYLGVGLCASAVAQSPCWEVVMGDIVTRWAKEVTPDNVLPDYPRPAMRRPRWINLNGLWEFAIRPKDETSRPASYRNQILVPFCVESALSGIKRTVRETDRLWYRRTFEVPAEWQGERILLHFGAVDWEATVWVNGLEATRHRGGYEPFSVDVTDLLDDSHPQEIVVSAWDPSDKGRQPRGKQVIIPHGFNYTGASGIWQTVWTATSACARLPSRRTRMVSTVSF